MNKFTAREVSTFLDRLSKLSLAFSNMTVYSDLILQYIHEFTIMSF